MNQAVFRMVYGLFWFDNDLIQFFDTMLLHTGIEIKDFQTSDKTSDTIKYLPYILKIYQT